MKHVPDQHKTEQMWEKAISKNPECCNLFLITTKPQEFVKK